uniref:mannosyl-oligosaccharide 1,3-1,6-alpha-mannosidase n=1 Tax=Scleropages formosus TaxID=113540 RepID=A0A8C9VFU6_SCLFO
MKLKKQVTVCGGAIFCVAVFSLYLMLDRVQHDPARRQNAGNFPRSQISVLQNRIEQLEQLLEENHQIISHIKDSVLELTDTGAVAPSGQDSTGLSCVSLLSTIMVNVFKSMALIWNSCGVWKQGFEISYEPNEWDKEPLQVFVVPHSHNDPGWIKTFDKYYSDQTQHIFNNMLVKLAEDPRRKFIWSEISFLAKWWDSVDTQKQETMRKLILSGQLEIVTGGWVMTDEANVHYFAMIDQLIEGHQWLEKNIGVTPRSGWAVDPFGHSATMPYLLKRANLTSMLIQRVHYSIKKHLAFSRNLEFMWRQAWDTDSSTDIFCHMMPFYSYDVPHTCGPDPKICCQFDFKRLPGGRVNCPWKVPPRAVVEANVAERATLLLDQYRKKSKLFRSKVVLVPLGDDFRYDKALEWDQQYLNYQKLFDYMNSHPEMHVHAQFGTLTDYFNAIYKMNGVAQGARPPDYPVLSGDFFAYADREDHYWSGYYTSRPFYKNFDRVLESHLRGAEILYSLAVAHARHLGMEGRYPVSDYTFLTDARRSVGLFQHHDAITGTAKEAVVIDYGTKLLRSLMGLKKVIINAAHFLILKNKDLYRFYQTEPFLETVSTYSSDKLRNLTKNVLWGLIALRSSKYLVLFNPVEQERLCVVTVLVNTARVRVLTEDGQTLPAQLSAQWTSPSEMSPDGYQVRVIRRKDDPQEVRVQMEMLIYGTRPSKDKSGAYLFLPDGKAKPYTQKERPVVRVVEGPLFSEVVSHYQHFQLTVRINNVPGVDGLSLDITTLVDIRDQANKELAMRLVTDIQSKDTFFTDLNGFQIQPRRYFKKLPLQANFYPMPTMAYIQDTQYRLTLHTAQALGVASLDSGQLEVILDRRLMQDDNRGLGQGLKDNKRTANKFRILLERRAGASKVPKEEPLGPISFPSLLSHMTSAILNHEVLALPVVPKKRGVPPLRTFSPLSAALPCDIHLLNLRSIQGQVLPEHVPSPYTALILHRKGLDCSLEAQNPGFNCSTTQGRVSHSMVSSLSTPMSLSLMFSSTPLTNTSVIHLDPMEISTFRIKLR